MATKTFFTTSTFYTTYLDKEKTITKTRTNVRSSVVTETYSGGQYDYLPGPVDQQSLTPTIEESPQEKYLSLGPNIYGLVKNVIYFSWDTRPLDHWHITFTLMFQISW